MAFIQCSFKSEVLGNPASINAILPRRPAADRNADEHRCLWLLHGLSDDHSTWMRYTAIERYADAFGVAVVMPDVQRSFYADMAHGRRYWTYVSEELPAAARSFFRLSPRREDNVVAGLSMGGYGAFKLALRHPERFGAAASLSGALDLASWLPLKPDDPMAEDLRLVFREPNGIAGTDDDLFALAERLVASGRPRPALYQCCGTSDFLYPDNVRFRDHARALDLGVTYEEGPGNHEWGYWDRQILRVLEWLREQHP